MRRVCRQCMPYPTAGYCPAESGAAEDGRLVGALLWCSRGALRPRGLLPCPAGSLPPNPQHQDRALRVAPASRVLTPGPRFGGFPAWRQVRPPRTGRLGEVQLLSETAELMAAGCGWFSFFEYTGAAPPRIKRTCRVAACLLNMTLDPRSRPRTPCSGEKPIDTEVFHMHEVQCSTEEIGSMFVAAKRMACRYGQIGLAEPDDIIQAAMIKLLKKDDGRKPTLGWLYRAVHSSAMDAGRSAAREKQYMWQDSPDDPRLVCERADQYGCLRFHSGYVVREESCEIDLMPRLKNMLSKLSQPLKQVLVLYSEGYSYQDIARLTNTNIGTVRSRLHYARRRAKSLLGNMA